MISYQYSPLPEDRSKFRLVRLWPGPASAEIEIEIFHAPRSAEYEALSYAWGALERTEVAIVRTSNVSDEEAEKDVTIGITYNLAVALRHLKYNDEPRVLWIDALCINQDDLAERSTEVLDMGSIYNRAKQVIVWLGPSSKDSDLAVTTLRKLGDGVFINKYNWLSQKQDSWALSLLSNIENLKSIESNWFAIKDLLNRKWFSRLWVLQEVGLASSATLQVGQHTIDWKLFIFALELLWFILQPLNQAIPNLELNDFADSKILAFITISRDIRQRQYSPLIDFVFDTTKMACSDLRDCLYAIRDLLHPSKREFIVPDYSKSVEKAFQDLFLRFCDEEGSGELLTLCLIQDTPLKLELPSWVPDFSARDRVPCIHPLYGSGRSKFHHVATEGSLIVQAVRLASINILLEPLDSSYTYMETIQACKSWEISSSSDTYVAGGSTSDAFVDTFLLGNSADMNPDKGEHLLLSSKECKMVLEMREIGLEDIGAETIAGRFMKHVRVNLRGRVFFQTGEGFFGICPESANHGDIVVAVVGVPLPLVVRPVQESGKTCYRVVGACYMSGSMHGEPLLGHFPAGWAVRYRQNQWDDFRAFMQGDTITQKDPRVPLPPSWRYLYGDFEQFEETEASAVNDILPQFFENVETKEKTLFDPRLTPEALKERGVDIQEFVLV